MVSPPQISLFNEVIDFLASAPTREEIIAFRPSEAMQLRVRELLDRQRAEFLSDAERAELEQYAQLNHFMSMLKARTLSLN